MNINIQPGKYVHISQTGYIESVIQRFGMADAKIAKTPMSDSHKISSDDSPAIVNIEQRQLYMEIVGSVAYASYMTRPDISHACSQL